MKLLALIAVSVLIVALAPLAKAYDDRQLGKMIDRQFGRAASTARCIFHYESKGRDARGLYHHWRSDAVSSTGDYGLVQANYLAHHSPGETTSQFAARFFDPGYALAWAWRLSHGGRSWAAWNVHRLCGV